MSETEFNLLGKDWLTEPEAAFYCCVSVKHFRRHYQSLGISPKNFLGKKLFSKQQLADAIEMSDPWHRETVAVKMAHSSARHVALPPGVNLEAAPLRPFKPRKHKTTD